MIKVTVRDKKDSLIREFFFKDPSTSLEAALKGVEQYVINEQLNLKTDCFIQASFQQKQLA